MILKVLRSSLKILCIFCAVLTTSPAQNLQDDDLPDHALAAQKLTRHDLGFKKDVAESDYVLQNLRRILNDPLWLLPYTHNLDLRIQQAGTLSQIASLSFKERDVATPFHVSALPVSEPSQIPDELKKQIPEELIPLIENLLGACDRAAPLIKQSMPEDPQAVLSALFFDYLSPYKYNDELQAIISARLESDKLRTLMEKQKNLTLRDDETIRIYHEAAEQYDEAAFHKAVMPVLAQVDVLINFLWDLSPNYSDEFIVSFDTPHGKVYIGGTGVNEYYLDAFLIIDLGGNDLYMNNAGGANVLKGLPISLLIDRRGNDKYWSEAIGTQGAGIFGLGVLVDFEGSDDFNAASCSQGFGFFGLGILDSYLGQRQSFKGRTLVQGAGIFGSGILRQTMEGHTRYEALSYAQGFAGVWGFGLLDDQHGNDEYIALGRDEVGWITGHKFTMSQGFSIGMRPWFGGGLGILRDVFGHDTYQADVYGQGAGYWYGLGILFDSLGKDRYQSKQYAQGAGIHLAAGALIDLEGNDTYLCGAICQGAAHDYSVGILHDVRGHDYYSASSTAQGAAINNSFALLMDNRGDDTYSGEIFYDSQASGHDGGRRQYGSIALLLDLAGRDSYSQGWIDEMMWLKPSYGIGWDTQRLFNQHLLVRQTPVLDENDWRNLLRPSDRPARNLSGGTPLITQKKIFFEPSREVDPEHPTEKLFRQAFDSSTDEESKSRAQIAADKLKENPTAHLPYLISRMDSKNIIPRIAVEQIVDEIKEDAAPALVAGLDSGNIDIIRSCLYFLARLEPRPQDIPKILALRENPRLAGNCLYTLANWKSSEAFDLAMSRSLDRRETMRLRAAQALAYCPQPQATARLVQMLKDPYFTVRYAAQESLIKKGTGVLPALKRAQFAASNTTLKHIDEIRIILGDHEHIPAALERYPDERNLREAVKKKLEKLSAEQKNKEEVPE